MHMSKKKKKPTAKYAACKQVTKHTEFSQHKGEVPSAAKKIIIQKKVGSVDRKYAVSAIKHSLFLFPPGVLFAYELPIQDFTFKKNMFALVSRKTSK